MGAVVMDDDQLAAVERELVRLARGEGRIWLRLGDALAKLFSRGWHHELGFRDVRAYALERLSRSGRTASGWAATARRLGELRRIRAALESGLIPWSMAEVLGRVATAETEAELLARARWSSVREMTELLGKKKVGEGDGDGEGDGEGEGEREPFETIELSAPAPVAWGLEVTRMVVEHMEGEGPPGAWLEPVLAEGQTTLSVQTAPGTDVLCEDLMAEREAFREKLAQWAEERRRAEARVEPGIVAEREPVAGEAPEEEPLADHPKKLDEQIRQLAMQLASRDIWLGRMLSAFFRADGWRRLGYASDTQFCRERLGMSRGAVFGKMRLARRTARLRKVAAAVQEGAIGIEAAGLIVRVADEENEEAWIARAEQRTFKHLREEVRLVEMAVRLSVEPVDTGPPTAAAIAAFEAMERDVKSGRYLREAIADSQDAETGAEAEAESEGSEPDARPVQMSAASAGGGRGAVRNVGMLKVRIRVPAHVAAHWRELKEAYRRAGFPPERFVEWLCFGFCETWVGHLGTSDRWEWLHERSVYRCTCPVCFAQEGTSHHMKRRSQGGTDDPENMTDPCAWCHLDGIHQGRLEALPPASDITWWIGRTPIMVVRGRDRVLLGP